MLARAWSVIEPLVHGMHATLAAAMPNSRRPHGTHPALAPSSKVPAGHAVQLVLPVPGAMCPKAQSVHRKGVPLLSANDPSAHGTHAVWLPLLWVPAEHSSQDVLPTALSVVDPPGHGMHETLRFSML